MKTEYKVIFDDYSETKVSANTALEAKILAQAKRIEAGKPFAVRGIGCMDGYGEYMVLDIAHQKRRRRRRIERKT